MRDRLIETTIAYVGSDGGSGAANFEHVRRSVDRGRPGSFEEKAVEGGRVLTLDWRPRDGKTLNDCELTVKLVSTEGDSEAMQRVLVDADGLVLMLDADPAPETTRRNERAVAQVREALARAPEKKVPVVVQVNKFEGSDVEPDFDTLALDAWPRVSARAVKGDGIMETLQRAVDGVVESMQKAAPIEAPAPRGAAGPKVEGNPLLGALRQMLQSTVTEQMVALEARILDRIDAQRTASDTGDRAMTTRVETIDARMERLEAAIGQLGSKAAAAPAQASAPQLSKQDLEALGSRLHADTVASAKSITEKVATFDGRLGRLEAVVLELGERIAVLGSGGGDAVSKADMQKLEARIGAGATTHHEAMLAEVKEHRKAVRDEIARAVATPTQALGRAVDALASEMKKLSARDAKDAKDGGGDFAAAIDRIEKKTGGLREQVDALLTEWRDSESRLDELAPKLMQADAQALRRVVEVRDTLRAMGEQADVRSQALQTGLVELVEELQKKKKSWFA